MIRAVSFVDQLGTRGCIQRRRYSSGGQAAIAAWRMPWQQCSIYSVKDGTVCNKSPRARVAVERNSDPDITVSDNGQLVPTHSYVHEMLTAKGLPKWNAPRYVKAMQNLAYLANSGETRVLDTSHLKDLIKTIATNVNTLNNYELTRVIFACAKGGLLRSNLVTQSFLTLMEDEVMQRMCRLQPLALFRILHSVTHVNAESMGYPVRPLYVHRGGLNTPFDEGVVKRIVHRTVEGIANLGGMDIANLVCLVAYNGMFDEKVSRGINSAIKRRLWGIRDPIAILTPVISLGMFGCLAKDTVESALKALSSCLVLPYTGSVNHATELAIVAGGAEDPRLMNQRLFPLKLLEIMLRTDYQEIYREMDSENLQYLLRIRNFIPRLRRCYDWEYVPTGSVAQLASGDQTTSNRYLVPHIYGPYVMRACDPVRRVVVEAEVDWSNVHTWQRFYLARYHDMRKRHLLASGYKINNTY